MATKHYTPVTVAVTPNLYAAFDGLSIHGQGGFQSLIRMVSERITTQKIAKFSPDEFERIAKYATSYGEGGFQQRLRLLVSQWTAQHFNTLVPR